MVNLIKQIENYQKENDSEWEKAVNSEKEVMKMAALIGKMNAQLSLIKMELTVINERNGQNRDR